MIIISAGSVCLSVRARGNRTVRDAEVEEGVIQLDSMCMLADDMYLEF